MKTLSLMLVLSLGFAGAAHAEEESDKVRKARTENELEKSAEDVDTTCGTKLVATIDWASFDADPAWKGRSISSFCSEPLDRLRRFCEGASAKAHIAKAVKKLECRAVKDKAAWALAVKDGVVEWRVPPDAVNASDFAKSQFLRNL